MRQRGALRSNGGKGPGQCLERHDRQRIQVRAPIDSVTAADLLGGHVVWRADRGSRCRQRASRGGGGRRYAEVSEQRAFGSILLENVRGLDVPVYDPARVSEVERCPDGAHDGEYLAQGQAPALVQNGFEGPPLDEWHDQEREIRARLELVDRDDVRMGERSSQRGLAFEPCGAVRALGDFRWEHLDRDQVA